MHPIDPNFTFFAVLILILLSTPSLAHPRDNHEKKTPTQPPHASIPTQLHSLQRISYSFRPSNPPEHTKRVIQNGLDLLTSDWVGFFSQVSTFLPIEDATTALQNVYSWVFEDAIEHWVADEPEWDALAMVNGMVRLDFRAENGAVIPWIFVQTFVAKLAEATRQGFAGSYRAYYMNPLTGVAITVSLGLVLQVAPAAR